MSRRTRLDAASRRELILQVATRLSVRRGYTVVTREMIADAADISPASVSHYFGTMDELRAEIMGHAIRAEVLEVVAQGLTAHDERAQAAPEALRRRALAALLGEPKAEAERAGVGQDEKAVNDQREQRQDDEQGDEG